MKYKLPTAIALECVFFPRRCYPVPVFIVIILKNIENIINSIVTLSYCDHCYSRMHRNKVSFLTRHPEGLGDALRLARQNVHSCTPQRLCVIEVLHPDDQLVPQHSLPSLEDGHRHRVSSEGFPQEVPRDVACRNAISKTIVGDRVPYHHRWLASNGCVHRPL